MTGRWATIGGAVLGAGLVLWALFQPAWGEDSEVDVAIVFLADASSSMDDNERRIVRESHAHAVVSEEVLTAIAGGLHGRVAFAFAEFGNRATLRVDWQIVDGPQSAEDFALSILAAPDAALNNTSISAGLILARDLLAVLPWKADRMVVDVVGDGRNNWGPDLAEARAALIGAGVTINGMPMTIDGEIGLVENYAAAVIGGPAAFNLPVDGIDQLAMKLRQKIVMELW